MKGDAATIDAARLAIVAESATTGSLVREVLATMLPGIEASTLDPGATALDLERIDCVVVDATIGGTPGIGLLRRMRAGGYAGGAVLLVDDSADDAAVEGAEVMGARLVGSGALAERLAPAVVDAIAAHQGEAAAAPARVALDRTQRLIAAGDIALRMQHSLNNPLAALLAESQLLEMEEMKPEQLEAVSRIVEQLRRVIAVVRQLDGVGKARDDQPGAGKPREEQPGER